MEQTLGKRIMAERKRLGLTQDQLAERLGVTAQAVSKWENDQSCPDITMLPKLAEIFGTTTDMLLGIQSQQQIYEGEVMVHPEETDNQSIHSSGDGVEFQYDSGRKNGIGVAVWVLLVGGLLLASSLLDWNVGMWDILWPSGLLIFGIFGLFPRFSFFRLGCGLFGAYFLLSNLNVRPFDLGKDVLLPIFLLLFGLSLLADALHKPKKPHFSFTYSDDSAGKTQKAHVQRVEGESFECSVSFGEERQRVVLPRLSSGSAAVSFGELTVDLSGVEKVAEDCNIKLDCSFGELELLVPRCYRVNAGGGRFLANVSVSGEPDQVPAGVIQVEASVSFGEISIRYI